MATFDDGKEAGALRTIGEVAKATGLERRSLYKRVLELRDTKKDGGPEGNEA